MRGRSIRRSPSSATRRCAGSRPSAIDGVAPPPHGHFIARIAETLNGAVTWWSTQDGRELWRQSHRALIPNLPIHVSAAWLTRVDPAGPSPIVRLAAE